MKRLFVLMLLLTFGSLQAFGAAFYGTQDNLWSNVANWDTYPGTTDSANIKADCLLETTDDITLAAMHAPYSDAITFDVMGDLTLTNGGSTTPFTILGKATPLGENRTALVNVEGSINLPNSTGSTYFSMAYASDANAILDVNSGSVSTNARLDLGVNGVGCIDVFNSGSLTANSISMGVQSTGSGKVILDSGSISLVSNMSVGLRGSGVLKTYGGTLNVGGVLYVGNTTYGGTGTVDFIDGTITLGGFNVQDGLVDIEAASITVNRDESSNLDALIASGKLTGYGDAANVQYSVTGAITTLWAVPAGSTCINPPLYDTNDDCKIDLADFANLASVWLDCGFMDQSYCW